MATILIVDDDDGFLEMLGAVLTHAGYQVQKASNGQQAVSLYKSRPTDLVPRCCLRTFLRTTITIPPTISADHESRMETRRSRSRRKANW